MTKTLVGVSALVVMAALIGGAMIATSSVAVAQQASSSSHSPGDECKVTKGPNEGKTGTYGEDGWCEGDWGGTECGDDKCEEVEDDKAQSAVSRIYDGNIAALLKSGRLNQISPTTETRILGAIRSAQKGSAFIEVTDKSCKEWKTIPAKAVKSVRPVGVPPVNCEGRTYPVVSIELADVANLDTGASGRLTNVRYTRLSEYLSIPHSAIQSTVGDAEFDQCVDIYLDCQLDCINGGGGVFGDVEACVNQCSAVFDACIWEPF